MSYVNSALDTRLGQNFMESVNQLPDAIETLTKALNTLVESKTSPRAIPEKKKYYMVTKAARDGSEPIQVSTMPFSTIERAAAHIIDEYATEAATYDWTADCNITPDKIVDGFIVRSPDSDQDHEYVWKVFEVYI